MTKRENYAALLEIKEVYENQDLLRFIYHEIELLDKKNSSGGERKPSAKQQANAMTKDSIVEEMEENRGYTVSEMMKELACCENLSQNQLTALVTQLKNEGRVKREEAKGRAYFTKA